MKKVGGNSGTGRQEEKLPEKEVAGSVYIVFSSFIVMSTALPTDSHYLGED